MGYHLSGLISALFVAISLTGLAVQVGFVWRRKRDFRQGRLVDERPTAILSLKRQTLNGSVQLGGYPRVICCCASGFRYPRYRPQCGRIPGFGPVFRSTFGSRGYPSNRANSTFGTDGRLVFLYASALFLKGLCIHGIWCGHGAERRVADPAISRDQHGRPSFYHVALSLG